MRNIEPHNDEIHRKWMANLRKTSPSIYAPSEHPAWDVNVSLKKAPPPTGVSSDPLRKWLMRTLPFGLPVVPDIRGRLVFPDPDINGRVRLITPFVDGLARFIVAFTGGLSLVVPMLIMRIHQHTNKSLITTSVAVLFFAAVVSVVFRASNPETLGITAAYAAVLVVFVGTSS